MSSEPTTPRRYTGTHAVLFFLVGATAALFFHQLFLIPSPEPTSQPQTIKPVTVRSPKVLPAPNSTPKRVRETPPKEEFVVITDWRPGGDNFIRFLNAKYGLLRFEPKRSAKSEDFEIAQRSGEIELLPTPASLLPHGNLWLEQILRAQQTLHTAGMPTSTKYPHTDSNLNRP